ncbi:MAG: methyltransferase domain-containing protein [Planctomycetes bacterium]|nr:methyltransferase domain-containing protein [Planctomycetota bacterium]
MTDLQAPMQRSKLQNYNSPRGAEAYKADYRDKLHRRLSDKRERALLVRFLAEIGPVETILDLPCGHGRLSDLLGRHCRTLVEADWSFTMVSLNRGDHGDRGRRYCRASALEIPLPDRSVDVAVSFRLSHHLESQQLRERHLQELFRVARTAVVVTWFSATSLKNLLRELRVRLFGKARKNVLRNDRVREIAAACGFAQRRAQPLFRVGSGHVLGLFVRR